MTEQRDTGDEASQVASGSPYDDGESLGCIHNVETVTHTAASTFYTCVSCGRVRQVIRSAEYRLFP